MAASDQHADVVSEAATGALRRTRAGAFAKKILHGVGDKTIREAIVEAESQKQHAEFDLETAIAIEQVQLAQATEARVQFNNACEEVANKFKQEIAAVVEFRELKEKREATRQTTYALREELFRAQTKVAMLEIIARSRSKMKAISEQVEVGAHAADMASIKSAGAEVDECPPTLLQTVKHPTLGEGSTCTLLPDAQEPCSLRLSAF
jgi:hypothetical protein